MDEGQTHSEAGKRRKRRSASKAPPQAPGLLGLIRRPRFGLWLFAAMAALAAFHTLSAWRAVGAAAGHYGPLQIGMPRQAALDAMAPAPATSAAGADLVFAAEDRALTVTLAQPGPVVATIRCTEHSVAALACPDRLGVRIGDSRADLVRAIGPGEPSGSDAMAYPAIGTRFVLQGGQVAAIEVAAPDPAASRWPIVLWRLLP